MSVLSEENIIRTITIDIPSANSLFSEVLSAG
jgi:hypothetical protein